MKICLKNFALAGAAVVGLSGVSSAVAGEDVKVPLTLESTASGVDWLTGEGVSLGGILFPQFHGAGVLGGTTGEFEELAQGHHDPQTTLTLQALEFGLSLRLGDYIEGFAVYSAYTDAEGELDGELEEAFLKLVNLPGGFELRGGRFFNRFGFQNALHNHAWNFVNQNLTNGRFLQEGELITEGGELTWMVPAFTRSALSISFGQTLGHDGHDHGHDDHDEPEFEAEGAEFTDEIFGIHYFAQWDANDFHQNRFTLSAAFGDNEFGRTTQIYGLGYEYLWRQNGYQAGGSYFRWRNEVFYRHIAAVSGEIHEEHDDDNHDDESRRANLDEAGFYSSLAYGFNDYLEAGLRFDYVSGIGAMDLDSRFRVSPNLTVGLNAQRTAYARVQYDFINSSEFGNEHAVYLQVGFNWGGPEVR